MFVIGDSGSVCWCELTMGKADTTRAAVRTTYLTDYLTICTPRIIPYVLSITTHNNDTNGETHTFYEKTARLPFLQIKVVLNTVIITFHKISIF